jgi:hypothetical protein
MEHRARERPALRVFKRREQRGRPHRLNYFCGAGSHDGLWEYPNRRSEPWTILIAPFTATSLHQRRAVRRVWM